MQPSNQSRPHSTAASRTRTLCLHAAAVGQQAARPVAAADVFEQRIANVARARLLQRLVEFEPSISVVAAAVMAQAAPMCGTNPRAGWLIAVRVLRPRSRACVRCRPAPGRAMGSRHVDLADARARRQASTPSRPFIAIHGQCAQLLQVALLPAVGASISVLPGASWRMRCSMPLSVATMYSFARAVDHRLQQLRGRAHHVGLRDHALGRLGVHQHHRVAGARLRSSSSSSPLNSSCTMQAPFHSSMSAPVCLLDVAAQVPVGRPQDLLALVVAGARTMASAQRTGHHPVGARLHRGAGVGIDHHRAVGVRVAERGELVGRAAEVERAGGVEVGHQHALVRRQDLGGLAHEAHAGDHQRLRRVVAAEARHLQRIGDAAAGLAAPGPAGRRRRSSAPPSRRRAPSARARCVAFNSSRRGFVSGTGTLAQACAIQLAPLASARV